MQTIMIECTVADRIKVGKSGPDKPLVSIVMATYNPRMDWLKEQLVSLNNQSYDSLELLIIDDCSTEIAFDDIEECIKVCITKIPYQMLRSDENLGSTKTFEKLTMLAKGTHIAYCDQDDIWDRDKIKNLMDCFTKDSIQLAYSNVRIIDASGNRKASSITEFRGRHLLYEGSNLSEKLIIQNFVIGCTMLIKREIAQSAVPFVQDMVHDHYIALIASLNGELALYKEPLVSYRIHDENQTNTLTGVNIKKDYYNYKIKSFLNRIKQLEYIGERIPIYNDIKRWAEARDSYYKEDLKSAKLLWKYRHFDLKVSLFELILPGIPRPLFQYALKKIKEGRI